ncbi:MAG: T9SS type A sorting domain-containing protein [Bacteroidales bacterium]|nr:T9SS type A sorting domain-containing protein [Bacteroidales bacterium]
MKKNSFIQKRVARCLPVGWKKLLAIVAAVLALPSLLPAEPFSVQYAFDSIVSGQNGRTDPGPLPQVEGLTFGPFRAVPGQDAWKLGTSPSAKGVFSFKGWPLAGQGGSPDQYYEFTLSPDPGREVRVESITFKVTRSSTGIRHYAVRSSADNYAANLPALWLGQDTTVRVLDGNVFEMADVEKKNLLHQVMVGQSSSGTLTFRFYGWDAESAAGTFVLDDVTVAGEIFLAATDTRPSSGDTIVGSSDLLLETWGRESWENRFGYRDTTGRGLVFAQTVRVDRRGLDAALEVFNPSETESIALGNLQLSITDTTGQDIGDLFAVFCDPLEAVAPRTEAVIRIRLLPKSSAHLTAPLPLRLGGSFEYRQAGEGTLLRQWLYPFSMTAYPTARYQMDYLLPWQSDRPLMLRLGNLSDFEAMPINLNGDSSKVEPASLQTDTLPAHASRWYEFRLQGALTDNLPGIFEEAVSLRLTADTTAGQDWQTEAPAFHLWLREVETGDDAEGDYLCMSMSAEGKAPKEAQPDYIYTALGDVVPVKPAEEAYLADWYYRDSIVSCGLLALEPGWHYGVIDLDLPEDSLSVLGVSRLADNMPLPAQNYWMEGRRLHLLDNVTTDTAGYAVRLEGQWQEASFLTEIHDSICLNDPYLGYGFELPRQLEAGDFVFCDTLLTAHGLDSLVCLYLNVCPLPEQPGEIFGDSLLVRAGNYEYTIRPVPSALFYVWTAFPEHWLLSGGGESVVLNIPYPGSGSISVKAVNRCGESAVTTMPLQGVASGLGDTAAGLFRIYPNPTGSDFSLETEGIRGKTRIAVSDMAGRLIHMEEKNIDENDRIFRFSLEGYAGGMYIISIVNENMSSSIKMEKK